MRQIFLSMIGLSIVLSANFTRQSNDTVTDSCTGLQWQDNAVVEVTWTEAMETCENLTLGGYDDWRLPNITELLSIVDDKKTNPSISNVFRNTSKGAFWSSSYVNSSSVNKDEVYTVDFLYGHQTKGNKPEEDTNYFRCVRGGI